MYMVYKNIKKQINYIIKSYDICSYGVSSLYQSPLCGWLCT